MNWLKWTYAIATFIVAALFLGMYIASGEEFCLIPVGLVLFDYIRVLMKTEPILVNREIPRYPRTDPRSPYYVLARANEISRTMGMSSNSTTQGTTGQKLFEFIKDEEFRV